MKIIQDKKQKKSVGRPTVMTSQAVNKLQEVFALGGSDEEACFYADISRQTLYDYQKSHPEFIDRKEALKEKPILLARQTAIKKIPDSYANAMDYLSRKKRDEFGNRQVIKSYNVNVESSIDNPKFMEVRERLIAEFNSLEQQEDG